MEDGGSISVCIDALKRGEPEAAQRIWDAYFQKLVTLASARLQGLSRRVADEEDVALSAFDSFCRAVGRGRFPRLDDRDDLWQILVVITVRKACDLARYERSASRGGGRTLMLSDLEGAEADAVLGREPTPELAAQVADECSRLLGLLGNDSLRSVALAKMEGLTNQEIADRLGCVRFTVDRKLQAILRAWESDRQAGDAGG